ncbi:MAG: AraC family transcriptional regulator [Microbacterium sp.]
MNGERGIGGSLTEAQATERVFGDVRVRLTRATGGALPLPAAAGMVSLHGVRRGRVALNGGGAGEVAAGGALIVPPGENVTVTVLRPSDLVSIAVPPLEGVVVGEPGVRLAMGGDALLGGALAFAAEIVAPPGRSASAASAQHIELLLRDMVARILAAEGTQSTPPPVQHAFVVIMRSYADAGLSSRRIAEDVNLSVRQLERQFQAQGTSIAGEVRRTRIAAAARLLSDDAMAALSIDQIARRVGFSGGSPLARAMAREGMPAPSALRATMRRAG